MSVTNKPDLSEEVFKAASELVDSINYDNDGEYPYGGNGGLLSTETVKKSDVLRTLLIKAKVRD